MIPRLHRFPLIPQAQLANPPVDVIEIQCVALKREDRRDVVELTFGLALLRPLQLGDYEIFRAHDAQIQARYAACFTTPKLLLTEWSVLPNDEIDLPPGFVIDGVEK